MNPVAESRRVLTLLWSLVLGALVYGAVVTGLLGWSVWDLRTQRAALDARQGSLNELSANLHALLIDARGEQARHTKQTTSASGAIRGELADLARAVEIPAGTDDPDRLAPRPGHEQVDAQATELLKRIADVQAEYALLAQRLSNALNRQVEDKLTGALVQMLLIIALGAMVFLALAWLISRSIRRQVVDQVRLRREHELILGAGGLAEGSGPEQYHSGGGAGGYRHRRRRQGHPPGQPGSAENDGKDRRRGDRPGLPQQHVSGPGRKVPGMGSTKDRGQLRECPAVCRWKGTARIENDGARNPG